MIIAEKPHNEKLRLETLHSLKILDTPPSEIFDGVANLAAQICDCPIALITLLDGNRQWFKSKIGLKISETPRDIAFCSHAILDPQNILEIPDASADQRFIDNPLVTADPKIRFYAGAPITLQNGAVLGTLCVIDRTARKLAPSQRAMLKSLREVVSQLFERIRNEKELYKASLEYIVEAGGDKDRDGALEGTTQDALYVKVNSQLVKVLIHSILWIEAYGDYVKIHTEHDKYIALSSMKEIEDKLPAKRFFRVHRSYIIQLSKIKAIEDTVIIIGKDLIPIGDSFRRKFMHRLNLL